MGAGKDAFAEGENALIRASSSITYRCAFVVSCARVTVPVGVDPGLGFASGAPGSVDGDTGPVPLRMEAAGGVRL